MLVFFIGGESIRYNFDIKEIDKNTALEMVQKYHYSNTLPRLNKIFVGFYLEGALVGVVTLGWGTRPRHTIQKVFPTLDTKDYFEIGRMCMTEDMPRNSESQMLSQLIKWLKVNYPELKVLFTWADGMLGKVGYVYQASNFYYAGNIETDFYLMEGIKIHPRQTRGLFAKEGDKRKTIRPTQEQMKKYNIEHYKGKQFKYIYFLTNKKETRSLIQNSLVDITKEYPKEDSLKWKINIGTGKWAECSKPNYKTDIKVKNGQLKSCSFCFPKNKPQE